MSATPSTAAGALSVKGVDAVLEVDLDRGARGLAVFADGYWPAKTTNGIIRQK